MTLLELKNIIDGYLEDDSNNDLKVVVRTNDDSIGPVSTTNVAGGYPGFDWENGMFLLRVSDPIFKKNETKRS